jgi:EAL domain-containing protein (putative c-di-GMP-specific phosphodiesterase class I)
MEAKDTGVPVPDIPNMEGQLPRIAAWLKTNRTLAVVLIDLTPHFNPGLYCNKNIFKSVVRAINTCINGLRGKEIRGDDIPVVNYTGGSKYYIFLSKAREKQYVQIDDYEHLCLRIFNAVYNTLFSVIYPITGSEPQVRLGYAFTFLNPFAGEMQFLQQMLHEAEITSEYLAVKIEMMKRKLLHKILVDEDLATRYQPVISLADGKVFAYEAFVQGPPDSFFYNAYSLFNFARAAGLIFELDWISKKMIVKNARGMAADKKLFIKLVSSRLYKHELLADHFKDYLRQNRLGPQNLVFEIFEESIDEGMSFIHRLERSYREIGYAIVLKEICAPDRLKALRKSGVSYIKLGMEITRHIETSSPAAQFVAAVKETASGLGCGLIAEGVHNNAEMRKLRELGVEYGQGYFFAKPDAALLEVINIEDYLGDKELEKNLLSYIYFKRGKTYFDKGDYDKAILEFTKVVEVDTENADAYFYRSFSYCQEGVTVVALKDLQAVMRINPDYPEEQFLRAAIFEKKGDLAAALRAYENYVANTSGDTDLNGEVARKRIIALKQALQNR